MQFSSLKEYMLPCLSKQLFGLECPGCGMQRSLAFIIQGDFLAAFKMYPAIFTLILLFGYIFMNFKFKFKHSQKIILTLAIINVLIISISYILKMNNFLHIN